VPCSPSELNKVAKTQRIRQLDVWVIGPLMIWGGLAIANRNPRVCRLAGSALGFFGVTTIWYNARNYRRIEEAM
jgi:hypothetical protein